MDWRLYSNFNSYPTPPPQRYYFRNVARPGLKLVLARVRTIEALNGVDTDSGWSAWDQFVPFFFMQDGFAARDSADPGGPLVQTMDCMIEVAAGIGRPWKIIWRDLITDLSDSSTSYSSEQSQILIPGSSVTVTYDASDGFSKAFHSGCLLIPAEGS